jgi:phosphoribosyl-ATP pyrophosphohydrolase/phosphoribosyl-AMP cyclohydrolase
VVSLDADCDGDAVLARVIPNGPACHTLAVSCFGARALGADALGRLDLTIAERAGAADAPGQPAGGERPSYTRRLLGDRNLRLKKVGEEAAELVIACAEGDRERAAEEGVDLLYHALVALRGLGVGLDELRAIAARRAGPENGPPPG